MHLAPRQWHPEDLAPYNGTDPQKPSLATNFLGDGTGIHILIILWIFIVIYCSQIWIVICTHLICVCDLSVGFEHGEGEKTCKKEKKGL